MPASLGKRRGRFLVIGCGSIGQRHTRNLLELGVDDLWVYDPNSVRMEALARELGVKACRTLEDAYAASPAGVLVCVPTSLHLPLARQALEHGCHLFVEKPLSHSLEGVADFLTEVRAGNRVLMVGYNLRYDPLLQEIRGWLNAGLIGHIVSARLHCGSFLPWRHPWEDYRTGYGARESLGGGPILDAIHELDYALWFFGHPSAVYCVGGKYSDLEIDVEDVAEILLSYANSVVSIHLDCVQRPPRRSCEIVGTRGQIQADLYGRLVRRFDGDTREWVERRIEDTLDDVYKCEMRHFLDCIDSGARPAVDGFTAMESLHLAQAAKESMRTGIPVSFESIPLGVRTR